MDSNAEGPLLTGDDPSPVQHVNPNGASRFLLLGDHAGNRIPARLDSLGLADVDLQRHIAWDIGVGSLGERLATLLDAVFIRQTYSRLVIDCNRSVDAVDAIPAVSDRTAIPGNAQLSPADRAARIAAVHAPYQAAIAEELRRRDAAGTASILVSLHSFTPEMGSTPRPWEIGILHGDGDNRFALACLAALRAQGGRCVGDNEPYRMDRIDYTVPVHAFADRRPYVEIEIRQDQLANESGVERWATDMLAMLTQAAADIG